MNEAFTDPRYKAGKRSNKMMTGLAKQALDFKEAEYKQAYEDRKLLAHLSGLPITTIEGGEDVESEEARRRRSGRKKKHKKGEEEGRTGIIRFIARRKRKRIKRRDSRRYKERKEKENLKRQKVQGKKFYGQRSAEETTISSGGLFEKQASSSEERPARRRRGGEVEERDNDDDDDDGPEGEGKNKRKKKKKKRQRRADPLMQEVELVDRPKPAEASERLGVLVKGKGARNIDHDLIENKMKNEELDAYSGDTYSDENTKGALDAKMEERRARTLSRNRKFLEHSDGSDWGLLGTQGRGMPSGDKGMFDGVIVMEVEEDDKRAHRYRNKFFSRMWTGRGREIRTEGNQADRSRRVDDEMQRLREEVWQAKSKAESAQRASDPQAKPENKAPPEIEDENRRRSAHYFTLAKEAELQGNVKEAIDLASQAAILGNGDAQLYVGVFYANGRHVLQNYTTAVRWFTLASANEVPEADYYLGLCYVNGAGVAKDEATGFKYWSSASEKGYNLAQHCLAACYEKGIGVAVDMQKALAWYTTAAEGGNEQAKWKLTQLQSTDRQGTAISTEPPSNGWQPPQL
mmetsp:Transcript_14914/g.36502  ORF Transcript_14914/g.36502 Transcript_14914/m.36502 type:complete len:575 (-) Transcript_14914:149-1873(-)